MNTQETQSLNITNSSPLDTLQPTFSTHYILQVTYTYQVAAMNSIGISEFSELGSGKTPAVLKVRSPESLEMKAALECKEAWTEVGVGNTVE